jgi:hypothetical protein
MNSLTGVVSRTSHMRLAEASAMQRLLRAALTVASLKPVFLATSLALRRRIANSYRRRCPSKPTLIRWPSTGPDTHPLGPLIGAPRDRLPTGFAWPNLRQGSSGSGAAGRAWTWGMRAIAVRLRVFVRAAISGGLADSILGAWSRQNQFAQASLCAGANDDVLADSTGGWQSVSCGDPARCPTASEP